MIAKETTVEEQEIRDQLKSMERNKAYATLSSYSANDSLYPNNRMSFTEKHLAYLKSHPALQPAHYLANLRLKTKKRS